MKKITLLLLLFFVSLSGYSQFTPVVEGFESTAGPEVPPSTDWYLGTGTWAVFDNDAASGITTTQRWSINTLAANVYEGANAAYMNRENIGAGNTSEDFLATPSVLVPNNGELHFYARTFASGQQGTIFQIRVAPGTASQNDPAAYSIVQTYSEAQLSTLFNVYEEKVVNLSAFAGQNVYIAFVQVFTQPTTALGGDRWLLDKVSVVEKCIDPTNLTISGINSFGATLNWNNTSGATSWEIEVVPVTATPTGSGTIYNGAPPFPVSGLQPNTTYNYYVRALCTNSSSAWVGPSANFTTLVAPPICGGNYIDSGGLAGNYSNNITAASGTTTINPINVGEVVTVTFTTFNTEPNNDVLKIYNGAVSPANLIGTYSGTTLPPVITSSAADGSLTFVFTSNASITAAGWTSNITCGPPVACPKLIALNTSALLSNSVIFGWTATGSATTWQVLALPCSAAAPTAATTGWVSTTDNPYTITGLTSGTCYNLYVRSDCGAGGVGEWAGPISITTPALPPACGGNYVDGGGLTGNYTNNSNVTTPIIPTTPGDVVTVTFTSFNTELNNDVIKIYNGAVSAANLIGTFSGTTLPPVITSSAPDGSLTFVFTSNASVVAAGWVANITCAPPAVTCTAPVALATSALVANSVSLEWTPTGSATSWQVIALPCTDPAPTASTTGWTAAGTNPFTITGLNATTCYNLYVRSDCSSTSGGVSPWSLPISITTPCSFYTVPFQEGFNSTSTSEQCWKVINGNTDADQWNMNYATNPFEGDQVAVMLTDGNGAGVNANNDWLISPQIILTGNQRLKFHYRVESAAEPNQFKVMLSTTGSNQADFTETLVPLTTYSNTGYIEKKVNISAYSGPVYIAWQVPGGLDGWRVYIDNVIVENLPACTEPDAVIASNVSSSTVDLTWTNGNTETAWEVLALPCATTPPTASATGYVAAGSNPFTLTGLNPNQCYDIYVRAVCSSTDKSIWTSAVTINTLCLPFTVPFQEGFNSTSTTESCWTVLNVNGDTDAWDMNYATNPYEGNQAAMMFTDFNAGANNDWLISPQITLNGNQRLRYRYRVQSATEPNDFRVMLSTTGTAPASFTTTIVPLATYSNITYVEKIVNLTGITGDANIAFHVPAGGADGWRLYIDKFIVENLPTCFPPINLTVSNIEATSALLGWTDTNTPLATQWEVIFVPQGDPEPLPSDVGELVSFNPALMTGLLPGTSYTYYVRSVCSSTDKSEWSLGANFTTLIVNDNCIGAVFAVVNQSQICQQSTPGTITGATASTGVPAACIGTANDDVWFTFLATNPYLNIELQNIIGTTTNLNFAIYSGSCGGPLTQVYCSTANDTSGTVNNLTLGQTYFIRVYSNGNTPQTASFDLCITTPSSCLSGTSACQNLQYQNTTGVNSQGTIGCLSSSPNPTYYTINVSQDGPINLLLTQSTTQGGPPNLDVDYAAWGPFTSQAAACAAIGNPPTLAPGIGVPVSQTTGCSFSPASTETLNIANATIGQVYVILITNYSDDPGFISLTQTNDPSQPGAGTYNCCPDAFFKYTPVTYCKSSGATNPIPTIDAGSLAGTFSLDPLSPTGLVFANTATGEVDLAASAPGNYIIKNTVAANPTTNCAEAVRGYTISIVEPLSATIAYGAAAYCKSITTLQPVTVTGTTGGSFSVSPNGGLYINTTTGDINPSLSQPGIYTISYGLPSSPCTGANPSTTVQIYGLPNIPDQGPITKCDTYTLPALPEGNYYANSQLTGPASTPLDITIPITTTQVIYAYGITANGCTVEKSFTVTINKVDQPTPVTIVDPTCTVLTGTVTVTPPASVTLPVPANLFISEVTDSDAGSLTYVELYNGTGAPINLNGYRLKFYTTVTGPPACDLLLSGTIANNAVNVIKVSANPNQGGVVPNQSFPGCGGVNNNDNIRLTTAAGVEIDLWGKTDGSVFTPANQTGYTYRRLATAPHPSLTWNPADWTAIDPEDYSNVGSYTYVASSFEYALDSNPYQSGTTFNNVTPGDHTITVHNTITDCYSAPYSITLNVVGQTPSVADFTYPSAQVCNLDTTNPMPIQATGFTAGGAYSYTLAPTTPATAVLALNTTTGEIDLATSTPGIYYVKYEYAFDPITCQAQADHTETIEILDPQPANVIFSYTSPFCKIAAATLAPTLDPNFVSGGTFSGSAGLVINASTGVIDLALTPDGTYDVYYAVNDDFNAALGICQKATTSPAAQVIINPSTPAIVGFTYTPTTVCKIDPAYATVSPILDAGFETGGTFSATPAGLVFLTNGVIDVVNSAPNTYAITYTVADNTNGTNCIKGGTSSPFSITIIDGTTPVVGFHYNSPICAGITVNPMPILDAGFVTGGIFSSTQLTVDPNTGEIDLSSVTSGQTYTVNYDLPINVTAPNCQKAGAPSSATIVIADPIAVNITGECVNNKFTLTANPVNNSFVPTAATYNWEDAGGASVGTDQTLVITTPGLYSVTVNTGGCDGSDADTFSSVLCQIQKGISANSSPGKNDFFDLSGMNVKKLTIFNRYGMKVYSKANYVNEWGGQSDKGDELPDGTYYYVIERNNGENITNWIYINRAQ
ncbi:choice-of-anchor J domain-containing protein [Flavobacterium phycosphaerae]|uniref:choice-of-anchor J domain-containing protein n=1 Tax=Flavobacterium phycosphaerae TaxID=2697515 RepID=UPI00138A6C49|nr:choice-of-anchor J domain-containing protein [Flavobacterium phycosphaerae]